MKKNKMTIERRKKIQGFLFVLPWLIGLLTFFMYPLVMSFIMSLHRLQSDAGRFIWIFRGLGNYSQILIEGTAFLDQFIPFILRTIIITPIIVLFAVIVALLLNQKFAGRGLLRAVFFLPVLFTTGGVIITLMTNDGTGVNTANTASMNATTTTGTISFLSNPALLALLKSSLPAHLATAMEGVLESFILILWYAGLQITLLIAGCQSIPGTIYEAATIDGANSWESLWKITLPGIFPFILISLIYTLVDQCTTPTNPLMLMIDNALRFNLATEGLGYAATLGWIFQVVMLVLIGFIFILFRKSTPSNVR